MLNNKLTVDKSALNLPLIRKNKTSGKIALIFLNSPPMGRRIFDCSVKNFNL